MTRRFALVMAAVVLAAGCHKRVITPHDREEAANIVSEAEFAVTIKDLPRAEGLYAKAAQTVPDNGEIWLRLGIIRVQMHNTGGARSAYGKALDAFQDDFKADHSHGASALRAATVLVLLGKADDAREYVAKASADSPGDRDLKRFVDEKGIDRLQADPELRQVTP